MKATRRARSTGLTATVIAQLTLALALAGCGSSEQPTATGGFVPAGAGPASTTGTAQVAVVVLDTSASVIKDTDLLAAAQNRVTQLVEQMPVGGTVAVKALNNMTANCADLTITLPEENETVLGQTREANKQAVATLFPRYIDCVTQADSGGTQLFGLLAETAVSYAGARLWDVYSDGLDSYNLRGLHKGKSLRDPEYPARAVGSLPPTLVPTLTPGTVITWHALGRGTNLDAVALGGLRQIYLLWTNATGATPQLAAN